MKLFTLQLPVFILAAHIGTHAIADDSLEIDDAWTPEAPPVSKVMAAYMEIENETPQDRKAVALQCSAFERAG